MKITRLKREKMRAVTLMLCALAVATTPLLAQSEPSATPPQQQGDAPPPPPHGRPTMEEMQERTIEHLTRHLNLTPDQVTQVRAIYKDGNTQMMSIRADTSLSREDKREKLTALHESSRAKVRDVLTEEQKPKFDEMVAHQQDRMQRHDGDHGGPPPPPPPPQ